MLHDLHMRVAAQQQLLMLQQQKQSASVYQLLQQVQAVMGPAQMSAYHAHASAQQQQQMLQASCLLQAQQLHMLQQQQQQQQQRSTSPSPSARQQLFPAPQAAPLQQPVGWPYPQQHQLQHHHNHHSPYHHHHQQQQYHPASPQDASNAFWLNLRPVQTAQADQQTASGGPSAASLAASAAANAAAAAAAGSGGWHGMRGVALLGAWAEQGAGKSPRGVARSPHKLPAVPKELEKDVDALVRLVVRVALWEEEAY